MTDYRIMTLNLFNNYGWSKNDTAFSQRVNAIETMLDETEPDLIGVQELTDRMMVHMDEIRKTFDITGESRHSILNNEKTAILYRKDRFDLIRSETFWLSDTPYEKGSRIIGSQFPRIVTFALLKDRENDELISFFNTHLDLNLSYVRHRQAQILRDLIFENRRGWITVVTGDFNDTADSDTVTTVCAAGLKPLSQNVEGPTLRGMIGKKRYHQKAIDHILTDSWIEEASVRKIEDVYSGIWPSDHYPLLGLIRI